MPAGGGWSRVCAADTRWHQMRATSLPARRVLLPGHQPVRPLQRSLQQDEPQLRCRPLHQRVPRISPRPEVHAKVGGNTSSRGSERCAAPSADCSDHQRRGTRNLGARAHHRLQGQVLLAIHQAEISAGQEPSEAVPKRPDTSQPTCGDAET